MSGPLAERTRTRLEEIPEIPSLPTVLAKVWDLTSRENTSAEDLGRAMSADPGLTGAILRLANSAYFGFPRKVSTVTQAIVVLGFETVKSLAMGASVFRALNASRTHGIDGREFLQHSLTTAMAARLLIERRGATRKAGTAFAAGILHDLGKLVIAEFLATDASVIARKVAEGTPRHEAEVEILGLTHAEIGEWFADRWNLPEELVAAVRWHHEPGGAGDHREFVAAVHLGNVIAHRLLPRKDGGEAPEPAPSSFDALGMDASILEAVAAQVESISTEAGPASTTLNA